MGFSRTCRAGIAALLSLGVAALPVSALVSIDAGKNQLFVNSTATFGYDSNIFANAAGGGDYIYSLNVGANFLRHAGLIGLDATVSVNSSQFIENHGEDFQNPAFTAEFTKQTGRTTGALSLSAARQSRADTAANLRNESWLYDIGLNLKYPVIERYSLSGNVGYTLRDFTDNTSVVDLTTYTAGLDLFYVYTTDRDLLAGYHFTESTTSANTTTYDHSFTAGVTGRIIGPLQGTLRAGYEVNVPKGTSDKSYGSWTANASAVWNFTRRFNVTGQLSKAVSTTSTDISVDALSASLDGQYTFNSKTSLGFGTGWSYSRFLGLLGAGRRDTSWNWSVTANRTINNHLKASLSYVFFKNWSTLDFSDYEHSSVTLSLSSRF
jgi:hypothetical protein